MMHWFSTDTHVHLYSSALSSMAVASINLHSKSVFLWMSVFSELPLIEYHIDDIPSAQEDIERVMKEYE